MGNTVYSNISRGVSEASYATKSTDQIFKQNRLRQIHDSMSPVSLGTREARDSDVHPNSIAIIIALDVTGSMGRIPENIVKDDLTHIMQSLIQSGYPDIQLMFLGIGDQRVDKGPLQIGQFESGDQELAMWLERTWLESGGGGDAQESYNLAWVIGGRHTSIDCLEKRGQKGILFTIGDEGFHEHTDIPKIFGTGQILDSRLALSEAQEKYEVFHIHANHGSYPGNEKILGQWRDVLDKHLLIAYDDKEIVQHIVDNVKTVLGGSPVMEKNEEPDGELNPNVHVDEKDSPTPATDDKPDDPIML